jgi:ATP synthase protein I
VFQGEGKAVAPTDDFDRRLARANAQRGDAPSREPANPSLLGRAFRIGTELVAAVIVGGGIGWLLDQWFGTRWLIVPFLLLGMAAGFLNVFRHAREMNEAAVRDAKNLPSVPDDDD